MGPAPRVRVEAAPRKLASWARHPGLAACFLAAGVCAVLYLVTPDWERGQGPGESAPGDVTPAADPSLSSRLLQAAVRIVPQGATRGGCGVLVDGRDRLVVTVAPLLGKQTSARVYAGTGHLPAAGKPTTSFSRPAEQTGVAGRLVVHNEEYGLVLLRLERLPEGAVPLPLAEQWPSQSTRLHSLHTAEAEADAPLACCWSCSSGTLERVVMKAHFCTATGPNIPWQVILQPRGKFCDAGAPVVNDQAALVALGAPEMGEQGFVTRLIDVGAIRTTLHDWSEQQQEARRSLSELLGTAF